MTRFRDDLGTENSTEPESAADTEVEEVGACAAASDTDVIAIMMLGEPLIIGIR